MSTVMGRILWQRDLGPGYDNGARTDDAYLHSLPLTPGRPGTTNIRAPRWPTHQLLAADGRAAAQQERQRIYRRVVHPHLEVQMRPCGVSRRPHLPDLLPLRNRLTDLHLERLEVSVEGQYPAWMDQDHVVPVPGIPWIRRHHHTCLCGHHRCPHPLRQIQSGVKMRIS